jgi:hypothetical protein
MARVLRQKYLDANSANSANRSAAGTGASHPTTGSGGRVAALFGCLRAVAEGVDALLRARADRPPGRRTRGAAGAAGGAGGKRPRARRPERAGRRGG